MTEYKEVKSGSLTFSGSNSLDDLDLFVFRAKKLGVIAFEFDGKDTISFVQSVDATVKTP